MGSSSTDCILSFNDINNNGCSGITLYWSDPCEVLSNNIRNNDGWGLIIKGENNAILTDNAFSGNTECNIGYNISSTLSFPLT